VAIGATGSGLSGERFFGAYSGLLVDPAGFFCVDLEGAAAVGANVIEAALGLAGVNNFTAAALRTANDLLQRLHWGIVATRCVRPVGGESDFILGALRRTYSERCVRIT